VIKKNRAMARVGLVPPARPLMRVPSILALLAGLSIVACGKHAKDEGEGGGDAKAPVVEVKLDSLISGAVEDVILATGRTDVLKRETVASPVAGKLLGLKVTEGQSVKAGQVVAVVRTKESESALEGAQAMSREARTAGEKQEAQRTLDLAEATQSTLSLRAKQGGTVASRLVQEGEQIAENESLLTILDLSTLDFQAEVPLSGIGRIKVGQAAKVNLQALPGTEFPARVDAVLPQVQTASQTLSIRLRFTERAADGMRNLLKADMAGDVRIVLSSRPNSLLAPKAALLRDDENGAYSVLKVGADSIAHIVAVKLGAPQGDRQEISGDGLQPGVKVVVQGQHGLADSTKVAAVP
jgi:RND family efflux transporter MFP subunit